MPYREYRPEHEPDQIEPEPSKQKFEKFGWISLVVAAIFYSALALVVVGLILGIQYLTHH